MPGRPHLILAWAATLLLTSCSPDTVSIESPQQSDADAAACAELIDDLPDQLSGESRRAVQPERALGAAWGDPAYVLTCGVAKPTTYTRDASCSVIRGVGWFVADDHMRDPDVDATAYALTHRPIVSLLIPAAHRTDGVDKALAELAPIIKADLILDQPCL